MRAKTIALIALLVAIMIGVAAVAALSAGFTEWSKFDFITNLFKSPAPEPAPETEAYSVTVTESDLMSDMYAVLIPKTIIDQLGNDDITVIWNGESIVLYHMFMAPDGRIIRIWTDNTDGDGGSPNKIAIASFNLKTENYADRRGTLAATETGTLTIPSIKVPVDWDGNDGYIPPAPEEEEPEEPAYNQPEINLVLNLDDFILDYDDHDPSFEAFCVLDNNIDAWGLLPVYYTIHITGSNGSDWSWGGFLGPIGDLIGAVPGLGVGSYCELYDSNSRAIGVYNRATFVNLNSEPVEGANSATVFLQIGNFYDAEVTAITFTVTDINTYLAGLAG